MSPPQVSEQTPPKEPKSSKESAPPDQASIKTEMYGIWKVVTLKESFFGLKPSRWFDLDNYAIALPSLRRFAWDLYSLDPSLLLFHLAVIAWKGIEPGITIYITGQLLLAVESCPSSASMVFH